MKKRYILIVLCMLFILTGCGSKSSFPITFEQFTVKIYDNEKVYATNISETDVEGLKLLKEMKEQVAKDDTGFVNSLFVIQTSVVSGTILQELVDANTKQLQLKLLKFAQITYEDEKVECNKKEYPGYITTFSYQLGQETLYDGQYYLLDNETLYMISMSSDNEDDIKRFVKSMNKITCK